MNSLRLPNSSPSCVKGDAPAYMSTPTRPFAALCSMPPMFWVPHSTCTSTACGMPLTCA